MKKILLIIPVVFCLVLSSLSIIPVHAESNFLQTPAESYPGSSYFVHPLDNLLEVAGNPKYYFWYNTYQDKDDGKHRIDTKFIYYDDEISVEEDNGIYTIKFLGVSGYSLISVQHDSLPDYDFKSGGLSHDVLKTIIFDSNTNELFRVRENGEQVSYITDGFSFNVFETNMFEADSGDLTVEITPELNGKVSKTVDLNGTKFNYPYIQVDVHNNTSKQYQYAFFIVNKGEKIQYKDGFSGSDVDNTGYSNGCFYANKPVYALVKYNWFWTVLDDDLTQVYAPCAWHFVGSGKTDVAGIYWEQLKLLKNVEYDVVVLACEINADGYFDDNCPISIVGDSIFGSYSEQPFELYRSSFTLDEDTPFNPQKQGVTGELPYDPDSDIDDMFNNLQAYRDKTSGKDIITPGGSKFSDYSSGHVSSSGSYSGFSYGSLLSNTRSFFSFVKSTLSYFPPTVITVFNLALWSLLIFALIRRLH